MVILCAICGYMVIYYVLLLLLDDYWYCLLYTVLFVLFLCAIIAAIPGMNEQEMKKNLS